MLDMLKTRKLRKFTIKTHLCLEGGGGSMGKQAPRGRKKAQTLHFYGVFLSCRKSQKGLRAHISRGEVANFSEPRVPRRGISHAFLRCFPASERRKPAFFLGFRAQAHRGKQKNLHFHLVFLWFGVIAPWGTQEIRVLGCRGICIWAIIKRGEF